MDSKKLMMRYAAGEEEAFEELMSCYKDSVYAFLRRFLSRPDLIEDVFQETFLQLFVSRDTFDVSRPLRPWLFTIAANKAKDALRRMQRTEVAHLGNMFDGEESTIDDVLNTLEHDPHMPQDDIVRDERAAAVRYILSRMPQKLREIIVLAYFHKFSYAEIAGMLDIPIGTVKSRLHTAVGRFAEDWRTAMVCSMAN
jgi:RNA polymerase sigma-70 factor (ECF subfamily)